MESSLFFSNITVEYIYTYISCISGDGTPVNLEVARKQKTKKTALAIHNPDSSIKKDQRLKRKETIMVGVPGKYKGCETCRRRRVKVSPFDLLFPLLINHF